ncbi:UDP-N-acetylglucosamine 2-epimerase (hydrolyzing) [Candidatus Pacearchaeota archaeon]|nr:UDP-N-acetylglucosamine 2-epimerase (hydrolyzing) [Candidatus Pacearchaeota archaeon]
MRKVTYFTGSRSEYGIMRCLLKEIESHPDFKLDIIVSGSHLSNRYGYSVNDIRNDGFNIVSEIDILPTSEDEISMVCAFGDCLVGVAKVLKKDRPDIFLIQGDRTESLAAAIAASYLNIVIAHFSGGDLTYGGTLDDRIRPAISDLAHIHFPSTKRSAEVLKKRGEEPWRVHFFGNPGVNLMKEAFTNREELAGKLDIDIKKDLVVVMQHPVEPEHAEKQIEKTMSAVRELGLQTIVIYPNSDLGSQSIIKVIKKYEDTLIKAHKTLSRPDFIGLMRIAKALVGNSSSGIVEAPSINLPVVNIGERQSGRETMGNVINTDYNENQIMQAIKKCLSMEKKIDIHSMPYYVKDTEKNIVETLLKIKLNKKLIKKRFIL